MTKQSDELDAMAVALPIEWTIPARSIAGRKKVHLDFAPNPAELARVADFLGIDSLTHWRIKGTLRPFKSTGWRLETRQTANLTQSCVTTLVPVPEKINEPLLRKLLPEPPDGAAAPAPEADVDPDADDAPDMFGDVIDLGALAIEALALALDPYPRADEALAPTTSVAPPGIEPLTDEALRPFAQLAELKAKLEQSKD